MIPVIAHIEHDISVFKLDSHALGCIGISRITGFPGFPSILTVRDIGERKAVLVPSLRREDQCPVFQGNAVSRCWCKQPPFRFLGGSGDVDRLAPGFPVVCTFRNQELGCFFDFQAWL